MGNCQSPCCEGSELAHQPTGTASIGAQDVSRPKHLPQADDDDDNREVGETLAPVPDLPRVFDDVCAASRKELQASPTSTAKVAIDLPKLDGTLARDQLERIVQETQQQPSILSEFEHVRLLCLEARVLEAAQALTTLENRVTSALEENTTSDLENLGHHDILNSCRLVRDRLKNDAMYTKLRLVHNRLEPYLKPEVGLLASALRGTDGKWAKGEMTDGRISDSFRIEVAVRFLEGKECDANGPPTQVLIRIRLINWPQTLTDAIALDKETDLGNKDAITDCKSFEGVVGGPHQLMSSMIHYVIRPSQFPLVSIDFLQLREYTLCRKSPLPGYSAGILVTENTPPSNDGDFEGWKIPPVKFGNVRMVQQTVKHFCVSTEAPNASNQTLVMKAALNVPKWLVSATLIKNIVIGTTLTTFVTMKLQVVDKWGEKGYADRIAKERIFYNAVAAIASSG